MFFSLTEYDSMFKVVTIYLVLIHMDKIILLLDKKKSYYYIFVIRFKLICPSYINY
jgi:hypothetical protein